VAYAYALKPFGFLLPTFIAAAVLSYQISPRTWPALISGAGLSAGLFVLFKFVLGLGLVALPKALVG
jgi:putative tricarboxylic transport membrane protein